MPLSLDIDFDNAAFGGAPDISGVELDFTGSTQYGSTFGVNRQTQDGYASGRLSGITVVTTAPSRAATQRPVAQSRPGGAGQLQSTNGLISLGNNLWAESPDSGQPLIGTPGSGSLGSADRGLGRRVQRRPYRRAGEHDHPATRLPGQRPVHQDPGLGAADAVNLR